MEHLDQVKLEEFTEHMSDVLNGGMLALMTSIGYLTGLFDGMAGLAPATSAEVAVATGLQDRYVREWLDAMVTGGIVEYQPHHATYVLPPEHAALLTRDAGGNNMAAFAHTIPLLADVGSDIAACFRDGGGVAYDRFDEFLELWSRLNKFTVENSLLSEVLPLLPDLRKALEEGCDVLEIGCGEGYPTHILAAEYPASRFVGYDFRQDVIDFARTRATEHQLSNVQFEVQDLNTMEVEAAYDAVLAFDVIHDQAQPRLVLRKVADVLQPDGMFLMVDIKASSRPDENMDHPLGPFLYGTSVMHCMTVSLALGGEGLGTMWGERQAHELLAEAGFTSVEVHQIDSDPFNNYYVARKA